LRILVSIFSIFVTVQSFAQSENFVVDSLDTNQTIRLALKIDTATFYKYVEPFKLDTTLVTREAVEYKYFEAVKLEPILELKLDTTLVTREAVEYKYFEAVKLEPLKLNLLIDTTLFDLVVPIVLRKDSTLISD